MGVYDARRTNFYLAFNADLDGPGEWSKLVAAAELPGPSRLYTQIELDGRELRLSAHDAPLWYAGNDHSVITSVPADLNEFLRNTPAWTLAKVTLYTNVVPTDEARRPRLGEYTGRGKFAGCTATVALADAETGRISVSLSGTHEQFGLFYAAILSRQVKPTAWHEPKPHWIKPRWLTLLIGYRGAEPEKTDETVNEAA